MARLATAREIAAEYGLRVERVYELARQSLIPHVRVGRSVRFDRLAVERWIEAGGQALPGGWRRGA
ncbi:helix-turn-helix domain-containing protein [Caldinitratiruptor microaerophilus]|uniref:Helix-turn-helix domain-containing protein n=1 Tax=Caldinitratiruptor microaerophilus TaxID=671077 RepID=A0AA35CIP7_9FIRM|nr:helix-turn-helix domain-containing protein [Caldinitratiruptor microaerophilus]BDG59924.1 hypothetical protein caldi_10140 [Caldinitratiruptor microaerophilus]